MKSIKLYILRDNQDGYRTSKLYLDKKSAEIALKEHYTEFWIERNWANIEETEAISYFEEENNG